MIPAATLHPLPCSGCGVPKGRADYGSTARARGSKPLRLCHSCETARIEAWHAAHPGARAEHQRTHRAKEGTVAYRKRHRALRNELSRPGAHHAGEEWTSAELEVADRRHLSRQEVAAMLGRTAEAVANARRRIDARDPRYLAKLGYDPETR